MKNCFRGCTHPTSLNTGDVQEAAQRKQREALSPERLWGRNSHGCAASDPSWLQAGPKAWKKIAHLTNGVPKRTELREEFYHINTANCAIIFPCHFLVRRFLPGFLVRRECLKGSSLQSCLFPACFPHHPSLSAPFHLAAHHHSNLQ